MPRTRTTVLKGRPQLTEVRVTWRCPYGHENVTTGVTVRVEGGGCSGHPQGEYCYCPNPQAVLEVTCKTCPESFENQHEFTF